MTASIRQLLADVANEAYAQWWNDELGEIQQIPDLIVDALLASPLATMLDIAAHDLMGEQDPLVRALLTDWRTTR